MENLKLTKSQKNRYSMYLSLIALFTSRDSIVNLITEFKNSTVSFKNIVARIEEKAVRKTTAVSGKTEAKSDHRDELENALVEVASGLKAYSSKNKIHDVYSISSRMTKSFLIKNRDTEVPNKAKIIVDLAEANAAQLADYGIGANEIADLKSKRETYLTSMDDQSTGVTSKSEAGKTIFELFKDANKLIKNELDSFADELKSRQYEFYKEYYEARKIRNLGLRHREKVADLPVVPVQ